MSIQVLLTVADVAQRLSVSEETIRRYLRTGRIVGVKLIREWRIRPNELENFLVSVGPKAPSEEGRG